MSVAVVPTRRVRPTRPARPLSPRTLRHAALISTAFLAAACGGGDPPVAPAPVATRLAVTVQPGTLTAGGVIAPAITAAVQDAQGRTVTTSTVSVSIAITAGTGAAGATLGGTLTRAAVNGIATFDDLSISTAGSGYTLTVQSGTLAAATSAAFSVEPGAAAALAVTSQPTTVTAGRALTLRATVRDAFGNTATGATGAVSVAIANGTGVAGAVLRGTLTRTPVNGVITFDDLTIDKAGGGYRLAVTAAGIGAAAGDIFVVSPGPPSRIVLTTPPGPATAGYRLSPVVATLFDDQGNVASTASTDVGIAITGATGAAGAVLSGTRTRAPINGVVTFANLSIDRPGAAYTLTATLATSAGVVATTGRFDVTAWSGSPTRIRLASDPGDYIGGGRPYTYTQADALIETSATEAFLFLKITGDERWRAEFELPDSLARFTPGMYAGLDRRPFNDEGVGGLSWIGEGRACNTLAGWIAIDSVAYDADSLVGLDLRFEQRCEGGAPALRGTIHWNASDRTTAPGPVSPPPAGLWVPPAAAIPASGSYVYLDSEVGDYIGGGAKQTYTPATSTLTVTDGGDRFSIEVAGWYGQFQAMRPLTRLAVGYYGDVARFPFHNPMRGGLSWDGQGRGCNRLLGWFVIDSITYQGNQLSAITLRFSQQCDGQAAALRGAVRWVR